MEQAKREYKAIYEHLQMFMFLDSKSSSGEDSGDEESTISIVHIYLIKLVEMLLRFNLSSEC